jgi:hypothetical protein
MFCAGMKETERQKPEFEVRNLDKKGDEKRKLWKVTKRQNKKYAIYKL